MPIHVDDLAQIVRYLTARMDVLDGGGVPFSPNTPSGGVGGAESPILAEFSASGVVIPTTTSKLIPISSVDTITSIMMTMGTPPLAGRQCVVDVLFNGVSIVGGSPPTFLPASSNPVTTTVSPVTGPGLVTCVVLDGGSGRDLAVFVMSGA